MILVFASGIYGGHYALAWNVPFRTPAEHLLWQMSAPVITCFGMIFVLTVYHFKSYLAGLLDKGTIEFIFGCKLRPWRLFQIFDITLYQKIMFVASYLI
jgi:hypothetical protein